MHGTHACVHGALAPAGVRMGASGWPRRSYAGIRHAGTRASRLYAPSGLCNAARTAARMTRGGA